MGDEFLVILAFGVAVGVLLGVLATMSVCFVR